MKRAMLLVLTLTVLAGLIGCANHRPLPASCVGGNCAAVPAGDCAPGQQCGQPSGSACDDGAVPAKKHCCPLFGRCQKQPKEPVEQPVAEAAPPTGAVAYPYYTTRGPRDFYAKNPGSIGP